MEPGKWIQEVREGLRIKPSDVERIARRVADAKGNSDYCISHSTLADIEAGSIPSIHKFFSLSQSLKIPLKELIVPFGIDSEEVFLSEAESGPVTILSKVRPGQKEGLGLEVDAGPDVSGQKTTLLKLRPQDLIMLPSCLQNRFDPVHYRYALIGANDDTMADLLPPRTLVEIDIAQNRVEVFPWRTPRDRPIYLVGHTNGPTCCWCQVEGTELTLVPHPLSQHFVRRFKVPTQASIIGRVTNAWLHFQPVRIEEN